MSNVKNVEAFGKLTGICTGYGGSYKPGQLNLQVSAMATLLNQARQAITDVHTAETTFDNATNVRAQKFRDMQRLCPRIINALKANGANALTVQDAQASVREMRSPKLSVVQPAATDGAAVPAARKRTARGLDYVSLADHFAKLVNTVSSEPSYLPNEVELKVTSLNTMLTGLRSQNDAVNQATISLNNSRKNRSTVLYSKAYNIVATAKAVKQYVRSAYGLRSAQSTEVGRIRFTKPMN